MKYLCLGYHDERQLAALDDRQRRAMLEESLAYQNELRRQGHYVEGRALQTAQSAATVRFEDAGQGNGRKVMVTDGPFAETKEQLGGVLVLEAEDMNHAIRLMSNMPCMRSAGGTIEIRPINEEIKP